MAVISWFFALSMLFGAGLGPVLLIILIAVLLGLVVKIIRSIGGK